MKRNYSIISFLFGLTVFSTILFQSVHSFHHLIEVSEKEKCHHAYSENQSQITHSHDYEHCFVCEFTFATSIKSEFFSVAYQKVIVQSKYTFFYSKNSIQTFRGSLFALRAPPNFIV